MRMFMVVWALAILACATTPPLPARTALSPPEQQALPARPDATPVAATEQWVVPLEQGQVAARPGILMSQAQAMRAAQWRIGYDEIRGLYEVDRRTWGASRTIYELALGAADREIVRLQPDWWHQHSFELGVAGGVLLGVGLSLGVFYAVLPAH